MDRGKIERYLIKIEARLAVHTNSLDEHMRRTKAAETRLEVIETRLLEQGKIIWRAQGAIALFGFLSCISSLAVIIAQVL